MPSSSAVLRDCAQAAPAAPAAPASVLSGPDHAELQKIRAALEKLGSLDVTDLPTADEFKTLNFAGDREMEAHLERARGELLGMTAEEYRDSGASQRRLKDGLRGLADTARDMARQDAREVVERFGQLGRRKFNLAA